MELYRLKICGEQVRSGVQFVGKYAVTCEGIQVSIPPNQDREQLIKDIEQKFGIEYVP